MGQPDDHERTRAAGFDQHLTKPVNPHDLYLAIGSVRELEAAAAVTSG
jgi:CheY-like chemotaxis protein